MNNALKVVTGEAAELNQTIESLKAQLKEAREQRKGTPGLTISMFEYEKEGVKKAGVTIRGLGMRKHDFFAEQVLRIVADTPEAEANRKAVRDYIEANKDKLSWKK